MVFYLYKTNQEFELYSSILAEAHVIKNRDTATSIAVRALNGKFKWAISGTPLHK